jgi:hypothetical protein
MRTELAGAQFTIQAQMELTDYNDYEQIVGVVYNSNTDAIAATFVKVASEDYPEAELIRQTDIDTKVLDFFFRKEITDTMLGAYKIEIKRVVGGVDMPIMKMDEDFLTIKRSKT